MTHHIHIVALAVFYPVDCSGWMFVWPGDWPAELYVPLGRPAKYQPTRCQRLVESLLCSESKCINGCPAFEEGSFALVM